MKKISKRFLFNAVLCAMLVFCVGFYSSAQPTTAWFSDEGGVDESFVMEELYVEFAGEGLGENAVSFELNFDAATKMADEDERNNMFEHAARYYVFTAANTGTLSAEVKVNFIDSATNEELTPSAVEDSGLRYYVYEVDTQADLRSDGVEFVPGIFEDASGNCLIRVSDTEFYDSKLADKLGEKMAQATDTDFTDSMQQIEFLNSACDSLGEIEPGDSKTYCVCFWAEYDIFEEVTAEAGDNGTQIRSLDYNVNLNLNAVQYADSQTQAE